MKNIKYLIVVLLIVIVFLLSKQQKQYEEDKKQAKEDRLYKPIRYWAPGHLRSNYYPFHVPLVIRRHHRFYR